jgi:hypothetical protein
LPTVKDNFKILHGLEVENDNRESILSSDDTSLISERTAYLRGNTASDPALVVESRSGQNADLQQWKDDAGQTIVRVDENGKIFAQDLQTVNDVTIGGDLVVQGTTTTIESVIATVQDPIFLIGGATPPESDDNKDRGIEFRWHDGTDPKTGFFGFQDSTGKFTFIPDSGNAAEVISGDPGDFIFNDAELTGNLAVNGTEITTTSANFNLLNANAATVNFAGDATDLQMGAATGTTTINNDVVLEGINLSSTSTFFTLLEGPESAYIVPDATYTEIGSSTGVTQINRNLTVVGDAVISGGNLVATTTAFNVANSGVTRLNMGGEAIDVRIGAATGTTTVQNNLIVDGYINVDGGNLTTNNATFSLLNTNATTINFAGAATDIQIGSATGTTNINNNLDVDGDVNIDGGDLTASTTIFNLLHTPETINFGAAATDIQIGSSTGTTNVNNNLDVDGNVSIDGTVISTTSSSFSIIDTVAATVNFAGDATDLTMGADTGNTTIRNSLIVDDDLTINGLTTTFNPSIANPPFTLGANAIDQFVEGLNADLLDDQEGSWYQARANHTGTQLHTTISDWEEAVEDTVAPMFVHSQQSGIVAQYNDETGRILLTVAGGGGGGATDFGMIYWMGV